jgi:hypothetical protein
MKRYSFFLFYLLTFACSTLDSRYSNERQANDLKQQLAKIVAEDGIDAAEARVIAENYHWHLIPWEGAVGRIWLEEPFWLAQILVGAVGMPVADPIKIHRGAGRVSWKYGPTINNPKEIWMVETPPLPLNLRTQR